MFGLYMMNRLPVRIYENGTVNLLKITYKCYMTENQLIKEGIIFFQSYKTIRVVRAYIYETWTIRVI